MAFDLFGFTFGKTKEQQQQTPSVIPPAMDDGASFVQAGGFQGWYVDLDGTVKSDVDLVKKYREMSLHAEVEMAIDDVINDMITEDASGRIVKLNVDKVPNEIIPEEVKKLMYEEFQHIIYLLDFNRKCYDIARRWYIDGRLYYHMILEDDVRQGIKEIRQIDPLRIKKVRELKKKDKVNGVDVIDGIEEYYLYTVQERFNMYDTTQGIKLSPDSVNYCHSGLYDYGSKRVVSYLHKAIKPLNQLRMVEDATVIYRWSRAPERRIFYIDVGSLPKNKAEQYLRDIMLRYRNKITYDATTGEIRDDRKHMSMLEDYWLPRREGGKGTEIQTLPGGQNLGEMEDVKYFQKRLFRSLNIPVSRLEADNGFNMGRAADISRDELKFAKFISRLRLRFSELFLSFLKTQLVAKGIVDIDEWEKICQHIKFDYSTDSIFLESKQTEVLKDRMAVLREVSDYAGKYFSERWIRKNILRQTDEDIQDIDSEIELEKMLQEQKQMEEQMRAEQLATQTMGAMGGQSSPSASSGQETGASPQQPSQGGVDYDASSLL
jgi:hypothetical protein